MSSSSHRRCQYQGPNCQGTAHAGHDVCARCYFDHIKPQLAAERKDVKRRRALKRERLAPTLPPRTADPVRQAITDLEMDKLLAGKDDQQQIETLVSEMIKLESPLPPLLHVPHKEEPVPTVPKTGRPSPNRSPLSDEQKTEIVEAYRSGLPTPEIEAAYKIGSQTLYTLVRRAGVPLRGQGGQKYQPPRAAPVAPPVQPTAPVEEPSLNGAVTTLPAWTVVYTIIRTETKTVHAETFNDAAAQIGNLDPNVEVISVAKVRP